MAEGKATERWSRRGMLQGAGAAAAGLAATAAAGPVTNVAPAPALARATTLLVPVTVLLPAAAAHPSLEAQFLAGLRLYLDEIDPRPGGRSVAFGVESVPVNPRLAAEHGARALGQGSKLVISLANPAGASQLNEALETTGGTLLAVGAGENVPRPEYDSSAVYHHSLGSWQASWALGQWAATNLGRRAMIVSGFFEAGYHLVGTFWHGFEAAGGQIVGLHVMHQSPAHDDPAPVLEAVAAAAPDVVFAAFSGRGAADFLRAYHQAGLATVSPLVGSSFLLTNDLADQVGPAAADVLTAQAWVPGAGGTAGAAFDSRFTAAAGRAPDAFGLLGLEAGQLVATAMRATDGDLSNTRAVRAAFAQARFDSPRGPLVMLPETRSTQAPLWLTEWRANGGRVRPTVVGSLAPVSPLEPSIAPFRSGLTSGWVNPYLCP